VYIGSYLKICENSYSFIPNSSKFANSAFQESTLSLKFYSISLSIDFLSSEAINCLIDFSRSSKSYNPSIFSFQLSLNTWQS